MYRELIPQALYASLLLAGSQASPTRQDHPSGPPSGGSGPALDPGKIHASVKSNVACGDVDVNDFGDEAESKRVWDDSQAGVLADEWINMHLWDNWVQNLDQDIFDTKGDVSHGWNCREWEPECELQKECSDYEKTDAGNAGFFLYYSLQQFHSFLKSFHGHITENAIKETLQIFKIQGDFEQDDDSGLNVLVVIAGALGILGGFGAAFPVFAGAMGVMAGTAVIAGNSGAGGGDASSDGGKEMADRVLKAFESLEKYIEGANGGVFGISGFSQDDIPGEMQKQDFGNTAVRALGDGQWLTSDPTKGLSESMDEMYFRMRQGLAWAMMRFARKTFVFIDEPVTEDECGTVFNAGKWDPDEGFCFRLFHVKSGNTVHPINDDVADKLWDEPYNIDKLEAYRNAYHCWLDNDSTAADTSYVADLDKGSVPPCFFSMVVVRGTYQKGDIPGHTGDIIMNDWNGQSEGLRWHPETYFG